MITEMGNRGWELACMLESPEIITVGLGTITYKVLFFFQRPIMQMQPPPTGYPSHAYTSPPPPYNYPPQPGYPQAAPMYPQVPPSTGPEAYGYSQPSAPPAPSNLPPKH